MTLHLHLHLHLYLHLHLHLRTCTSRGGPSRVSTALRACPTSATPRDERY